MNSATAILPLSHGFQTKIGFASRYQFMSTQPATYDASPAPSSNPSDLLDQSEPVRTPSATARRLASLDTQREGSFAQLGSTFLTRLPARALPDPYLVAVSEDALHALGFAADAGQDPTFIRFLSGDASAIATASATSANAGPADDTQTDAAPADKPLPANHTLPYASVYSGHQFGNWAGQLGDGRALGLGELTQLNGERVEWQLKGAGLTPYSRMGDGRAVLRSSIREFLCSEAMDALGVPTTRALAVIGSDLPIRRETVETAAVVTRFASSFVRFGHFEHFWSTGQHDALRMLADHVIDRFYPALRDSDNAYLGLLSTVTLRTAELMAQWQAVGFCHGVMNTDNMSILGLTIDYGPFGFLDGFDAKHICNHTDTGGRYAYQNQPQIGYWNLFCLAQALLPLIAAPHAGDPPVAQGTPQAERAIEITKSALAPYNAHYAQAFTARMRAKLGLETAQDGDTDLIDALLILMDANRADFTLTFRRLATISKHVPDMSAAAKAHITEQGQRTPGTARPRADASHAEPRDLFLDRPAFDAWLERYRHRLADEPRDDEARWTAMRRVNPKYVLRNHLAEVAIRAAREGDYSETQRLLQVLRHPFDEQPEHNSYADLPPDWAGSLEVSCSS